MIACVSEEENLLATGLQSSVKSQCSSQPPGVTFDNQLSRTTANHPRSSSKCVDDIATRRLVIGQRAATTRPSVNALAARANWSPCHHHQGGKTSLSHIAFTFDFNISILKSDRLSFKTNVTKYCSNYIGNYLDVNV